MERAVFVLLVAALSGDAQRILPKYNVDRTQISVSGVSSGACMATQIHVAFSSLFSGVAILAGAPYYCAKGRIINGLSCDDPNVPDLVAETNRFATRGEIDTTTNMRNSRVFIFNGYQDTVVSHGTADKVLEYYNYYVNSGNLRLTKIDAQHTVPTMNYGNDCMQLRSPYIGRCNYNVAYEALNHIYGGDLRRPGTSTPLLGDFYKFDQEEFVPGRNARSESLDSTAYIYVPSGCMFNQNRCRLHLALHGCNQGSYTVDEEFVRHAGFNEVGELNNVIIIYPQTISSVISGNPMGCWDWWGYTTGIGDSSSYATKNGSQMKTIQNIVNRVS